MCLMPRRSPLLAIASSALLSGACATTAPATTAAPGAVATAPASDDVVSLKERVTRLERRLADVDAKLGLLLAQRTPRDRDGGSRPTSITHGVREPQELGPRDLVVNEAREEASLGARAIDLPQRRNAIVDEQPQPVIEPEADDGSPPVVIRLHGTPDGAADDAGGDTEGPPSGASIEDSYSWAQARMKEGRYLEAIAVFEDILAKNGAHDLADNSMYWIGWAHQQRGDHKLAVDVWQRLPMRFPKSPKVPDALFGMAVSHEALGEPAVAETIYAQLISQYPKAERVKEARKALLRLRPR
jgi:tol-pal system protein YbgF